MIQEYTKNKKYKKVENLMIMVAVTGTELGQAVQALSIFNRLSPEGQLMRVEKTIMRMNSNNKIIEQIEKTTKKKIELKDDTKQAILNAEPNTVEMEKALNTAAREIEAQLPPTLADKIVAWRYLSMIGNVRTHGRKVVAHEAMQAMIDK